MHVQDLYVLYTATYDLNLDYTVTFHIHCKLIHVYFCSILSVPCTNYNSYATLNKVLPSSSLYISISFI